MAETDIIEPTQAVLSLLPKALALKIPALPLSVEDGILVCAVPEGMEEGAVRDLEFVTGRRVRCSPRSKAELDGAIARAYQGAAETTNAHTGDGHPSSHAASINSEGSAVSLASALIADAVKMGASDIHVEPYETFVRIRYRLDGVLREVSQPGVSQGKTLISRLKIMADLDIAEKRRPQDGRIRVREEGRTIDIRVSTLPTDFGEKVVLRILDKSRLQLDLSRLGFEDADLGSFKKALKLPHGMILVTGPTGSGKTTTLYAALNYLNHPGVNITTIEDPIEYNLPGINQTHVRADIGLTFAAALRSILRQDPNIVMVGEIRDGETAEIAIRAALTGHLVLSTLHTNDAPSAITRLTDMGVEPFLLAASLKMVLAQRLLRRLCIVCRAVDLPDSMSGEASEPTPHFRQWRSSGCPECGGTGYRGRKAVYEILQVEDAIADLVAAGSASSAIVAKARELGFRTLREVALLQAATGESSVEEVMRET
jgi:type IV pilus assembly protein PilB